MTQTYNKYTSDKNDNIPIIDGKNAYFFCNHKRLFSKS